MNNDIIFDIPDYICRLIDIDWCDDDTKKYMVKEDGSLWLPWCSIFINGEWDGIFYRAEELIDESKYPFNGAYQEMVEILINFHESKFDYSQGRADA